MKRFALILVTAAIATPAAAQRIVVEDTIACRDPDLLSRIGNVRRSGDTVGAVRVLRESRAAGRCRDLPAGMRVRVEEQSVLQECLAPFGSSDPCMWTGKGQTKP